MYKWEKYHGFLYPSSKTNCNKKVVPRSPTGNGVTSRDSLLEAPNKAITTKRTNTNMKFTAG